MTPSSQMTRRRFLHTSTMAIGTLGVPTIIPASALGREDKPAPSKRITVGAIGTGNMGMGDLRGFLGDARAQVVAVCDVNKESPGYWGGAVAGREPARRLVEDSYAADKKSGGFTKAATSTSISASCSLARTLTW